MSAFRITSASEHLNVREMVFSSVRSNGDRRTSRRSVRRQWFGAGFVILGSSRSFNNFEYELRSH
jgi:hypothetical protein